MSLLSSHLTDLWIWHASHAVQMPRSEHSGHEARAEVKPNFPGCTCFLDSLALDNLTSFSYLLPASPQDCRVLGLPMGSGSSPRLQPPPCHLSSPPLRQPSWAPLHSAPEGPSSPHICLQFSAAREVDSGSGSVLPLLRAETLAWLPSPCPGTPLILLRCNWLVWGVTHYLQGLSAHPPQIINHTASTLGLFLFPVALLPSASISGSRDLSCHSQKNSKP